MHKEDMKKVNKALADKKKEIEVVPPVKKAAVKKKPVTTKEVK